MAESFTSADARVFRRSLPPDAPSHRSKRPRREKRYGIVLDACSRDEVERVMAMYERHWIGRDREQWLAEKRAALREPVAYWKWYETPAARDQAMKQLAHNQHRTERRALLPIER